MLLPRGRLVACCGRRRARPGQLALDARRERREGLGERLPKVVAEVLHGQRRRVQGPHTRIDSCCPTENWFSLARRFMNERVWLSGLRPESTRLYT